MPTLFTRFSSPARRYAALAVLIALGAMSPRFASAQEDFIPYHEDPTPSVAPIYNMDTDCYDAPGGLASFCPHANGGNTAGPSLPRVDPCFIAQNAMRPCEQKIVGVDPRTIGTWKLQFRGGPWVWEIHPDGTYKFHSEAGDNVAPNAGKFAANNGRWMLKATNGYTDAGTYRFQGRDTWIATGQLGTAPWRLDAPKAASGKATPAAQGKPQPASPTSRR